jgi:hypothetical protein
MAGSSLIVPLEYSGHFQHSIVKHTIFAVFITDQPSGLKQLLYTRGQRNGLAIPAGVYVLKL